MNDSRREVKSRDRTLFHKLSRGLIQIGLMPNHVSIASVLFALLGAYGFYLIGNNQFWLGVVISLLGIQVRLLCNLMDGLMAVEGKLSSPQGELYNDVPDRFSDWFLLLGSGFAIQEYPYSWELVWTASILAVFTAYIRVLGASQGVGHDFGGPMAKQHRMAILNMGVVGVIVENFYFDGSRYSLYGCVIIIAMGSLVTACLRLNRIAARLQED